MLCSYYTIIKATVPPEILPLASTIETDKMNFSFFLLAFAIALGSAVSDNLVQVNVNQECVSNVTSLIELNLAATFQYYAKAIHYSQYDSEIIGVAGMFAIHAREKMNDAKHLMKYLIHRGVEPHWNDIPKPAETDWAHPSEVLQQALDIEKNILNHIIDTHTCGQVHHDPDLMHDMADRMILEEENTIFELASYISHLQHDGVNDAMVLPIISRKMYNTYKNFKDCFHPFGQDEYHTY